MITQATIKTTDGTPLFVIAGITQIEGIIVSSIRADSRSGILRVSLYGKSPLADNSKYSTAVEKLLIEYFTTSADLQYI